MRKPVNNAVALVLLVAVLFMAGSMVMVSILNAHEAQQQAKVSEQATAKSNAEVKQRLLDLLR